jgi:phosphopantetheinyl transferase (holo-ACP synthase)
VRRFSRPWRIDPPDEGGDDPRAEVRGDHRHRLRSVRHPAHRKIARPVSASASRTAFHRDRAPALGPARPRAASYAKRFAAKEATAKALGTGIAEGVFWRDVGWSTCPRASRRWNFTGKARRQAGALMPAGHEPAVHLTITDEYPLCAGLRDHRGRPKALNCRCPPAQGTISALSALRRTGVWTDKPDRYSP